MKDPSLRQTLEPAAEAATVSHLRAALPGGCIAPCLVIIYKACVVFQLGKDDTLSAVAAGGDTGAALEWFRNTRSGGKFPEWSNMITRLGLVVESRGPEQRKYHSPTVPLVGPPPSCEFCVTDEIFTARCGQRCSG